MKKVAIIFIGLIFCLTAVAQKEKKESDSCSGCIFLGFDNKYWKKKDKPFWDSIIEIRNKLKINISMARSYTLASFHEPGYEMVSITYTYHPSIDSTQVEVHYINPVKKK